MSDLKARFEKAAEDVKKLPERPDNDTLLKLYALYKQGSEGDVSGPKPGFFDFVGTAKYEAWAKLKGTNAIGHTRYSTAGDSSEGNAQPIVVNMLAHGTVALVHNGNLINAVGLREGLERQVPAGGAQRLPDGDVRLAPGGPHEQQAGHVGAGYCQYQEDCAEQAQHRRTGGAEDLVG